ncbi:MAG: copper chaperone PCu(A)C [Parvibaculum sp.]|nr:copper chaperone PCu(A)C [Parvibaculum sp.]
MSLLNIISKFVAVLAVVALASCGDGAYAQGDIAISGVWARPSVAKNGAAYLTLTNKGSGADALLSASSPVAGKVEIHDMEMDGTIMRMRKLDRLVLPAGETVAAVPGGTHIMLMGLNAPLVEGTAFQMRLTFEKAGEIEISVPVRQAPE